MAGARGGADFTLTVGINSRASYTKMQQDITGIINALNKNNPQTIKVGLDIDQKSIDSFRAQISQIQGALGGVGSVSINSTALNSSAATISNITKGLSDATAKTESMVAAINSVNIQKIRDALNGIGGISKEGASNLANSLSEANVQITSIKTKMQESADAEQRLLSLQVRGTNSLGQTVDYLISYDKKTGDISKKLASVSTKYNEVKNASAGASASMSKSSEELDITNEKLIRIKAALDEIQRTNTTINSEYTRLTSDLGGGTATGQNAKDVSALRQQYIEYRTAIEQVKAAKAEASQEDINNIYKLQAEMQKLMASIRERITLEANASAHAQESASKESKAVETLSRNSKEYYDALRQTRTLLDQVISSQEKWTKAANGKSSSDYASLGTYADELKELIAKLGTGTMSAEEFKKSISRIRNEVSTANSAIRSANEATKSWSDHLGSLAAKFSTWLTVSQVVMKLVSAIKQMVSNVIELDTAMTNLYKVTDETADRYDEFLSSSSKNAQELGRSMSSYIEQTANWAKMGFSIDESEEMAKLSSIYANVADVDDATAVSDMVTAMKAFNIEAENAITIIDPMNKLSNEFSVTAAGLGEGLSKSASSMKTAGADLNETLALLTGISEITQSPDEAGNFLKTASMRLRGMKGELEELGEEVDESVDSISKVQTQILNLTHGQVNIFDDAGNFRDVFEIWKEIAEIRNELSSTEVASLDEILFGKSRANQGAAMMQAFQSGQVEKAYQAAQNSAGSAYAEQEKWSKSLEAKLGELEAAWEGLSQTIVKSDFLAWLIETGTKFINILNTIIDNIGVLPTLIGGITAVLSMKKNPVGELIKQFRYPITLGNEYAHKTFN